jgi:signal transduction histidine kinase
MFILASLPDFSPAASAFLDALLLSLLVVPVLYFLLFRPIRKAIYERDQKEVERDKFKRIDDLKSEFISIAAHELRTPVAAIMGYTELLSNRETLGSFDEKQRREFLATIYESSERLSNIIDDILDVSRIESGQRLPLQKTPLSIQALAEKVIHRLSLKSSRRVDLEVKPSVPERLLFDGQRIDQVLENLLSNAIKYSPEESPISIVVDADDRECSVTVTDSGIGMSEEARKQIFEKFYRADSSDTATQGLGLGMSIVKQVIDDHGGTILVNSRPGAGTSVRFTIPRSIKGAA